VLEEKEIEKLLDLRFFTALSITTKRIFKKKYHLVKGLDAIRDKKVERSLLSEIYVASIDFLIWCCFVYRIAMGKHPLDSPSSTVEFILKYTGFSVMEDDIKDILDAPSSTISYLVSEILKTPITTYLDLRKGLGCWECCYEKFSSCGVKYGKDPHECFENCLKEAIA
jgi:hypothetical protein